MRKRAPRSYRAGWTGGVKRRCEVHWFSSGVEVNAGTVLRNYSLPHGLLHLNRIMRRCGTLDVEQFQLFWLALNVTLTHYTLCESTWIHLFNVPISPKQQLYISQWRRKKKNDPFLRLWIWFIVTATNSTFIHRRLSCNFYRGASWLESFQTGMVLARPWTGRLYSGWVKPPLNITSTEHRRHRWRIIKKMAPIPRQLNA